MFLFGGCCSATTNDGYQVMTVKQETGALTTERFLPKLSQAAMTDATVIKRVEKSNYQQLVQQYKGKADKWTDPDFLPSDKSLGQCEGVPTCKWQRIQKIIPKPSLFEGNIEPRDVLQGNIGDCYFLSALAAISEDQICIKNVFEGQPMFNENGIYKVLLRINGEIKEIVVDDWIPINAYNQPLFCQLNGNEFWVAILEKAWAKAHGSYANIIAGLPNEVMRAVTHAPTYTYDLSRTSTDLEKIWANMLECAAKNYPMCAGTTARLDSSALNGLIPGHAYTLIDAQEVTDLKGQPLRIVQLRNPWGKRQWKGVLCDGDRLWDTVSQAVRDKFGYTKVLKDDGIFHMLYSDFNAVFEVMDICHYDASCSYFSEKILIDKNNMKNAVVFRIEIAVQDDYIVELHQPTLRGESPSRVTDGFCRATLLIAEKTATTYSYVRGIMSREYSDLNIKVNLKPGVYIVYCKFDKTLNQHICSEASLSVYSRSKMKLEATTQKDHPDLLRKMFLEYSRNAPEKQKLNNYMWLCRKLLYNDGGFGFLAFGNDAQSKKKFVVTFDESKFKEINFRLKKPYKGKGKVTMEVLPGQEIILLARSIFNPLATRICFPPADISIQIMSL